jgi:CBS domain containing-hemolysin-like protein
VIYLAYAVLIALTLLMQAFYTGSEMGLYTVNRFRLRKKQHAGERSARVLGYLLHDPVGLLITFLLGTNISVYALTALVTSLYERGGTSAGGGGVVTAESCATLTLILPLFFSEVLTKNFVRRYSEKVSYVLAWGLVATKFLLYPVVLLFRPIAALAPGRTGAHAGLGLPRLSKNILHHLLSAGREAGELTVEQERLARNVLRVGNRCVADLAMEISLAPEEPAEDDQDEPPAVRTLTVSSAEGSGAVLNRMTAARTRLAVVVAPAAGTNGERMASSDVVGYVRLFDLLEPKAQGRAVGSLARPVPRLASHATLRGSLTVMQRECADVAVIEDTPPPQRKGRGRTKSRAQPQPVEAVDRPVLGVVRIAQLIGELLGAPPPEETEPRKDAGKK